MDTSGDNLPRNADSHKPQEPAPVLHYRNPQEDAARPTKLNELMGIYAILILLLCIACVARLFVILAFGEPWAGRLHQVLAWLPAFLGMSMFCWYTFIAARRYLTGRHRQALSQKRQRNQD